MNPTPFDDLMARIKPHLGPTAQNLARQYGARVLGSTPNRDLGAAAFWELLRGPWNNPAIDMLNPKEAFFDQNGTPFTEFHHLVRESLERTRGENAFALASSMMGEWWSYYAHARAGERVYELSSGLASMLSRTELRGIHGADLQLPYRSIYIGLPQTAGVVDREGLAVRGFFVTEGPPDTSVVGEKPGKSWWIMTVAGQGETTTCFFFNIDILDEELVEESLARKAKFLPQYPMTVQQAYATGLGPTWTDHFRWVMNVVLYATRHPDAEVTEYEANKAYVQLKARAEKAAPGSDKRKKLFAELKDLRPCRRIVLGRSVRDDEADESGAGGEPRPLRVRTLVAGHWRNQPHGEGRSLRKLIWIRPFWRGPDAAPELNPVRVLAVPEPTTKEL